MSEHGANYEAAAEVTRKLAEIERSYQDAGGSLKYQSGIRSQKLLKLDRDAHRPLFKNQLPVPVSCPRSESDPVYIFNPSENTIYPPDLSRDPTPIPTSTLNTSSESRDVPRILSSEERIAVLSKQNTENQDRINALLSIHEANANKRKHHRRKDSSSSSDSDSSTKSEKNQKKFAFISKKKDAVDVTSGFTPGALLFYEDVKAYDKSISQAVREFNNTSKPADFSDVLTKDLLLGKFIDLRRIKGELLNPKKGDTSYTSVGKEKGLEVSKFLHLEILDLAEWLYYFGIFKKAIKAAFPDCEDSIKQYGKYIKSQFWSAGIMANWKNIAGYDAAFRTQVANRKYICFSDWDHKDCEVLKSQFFGNAYVQHNFIPLASS
ncbi:hypothetical protein DFH28DRAFT_933611 [Melampsora americana]|nr:hypothetical protein DFH28DRAFT_933611 [Melampsora americana]